MSRAWWVLAGVGLMSFVGCLDLTIVNTAAPAIGRDLGAPLPQLQLAVNVFVVALSMCMVTAGRLADRYGRRRVLNLGAALFGLASLGAGLATGVEALVVFRFVQGAACAVLYTSSSTIVGEAFPPEQRGRAIGTLFAVNGTGLAAGPLLGGLVVGLAGWRWVFLVNVPIVVVALAMSWASVPASRPDPDAARTDRAGLALLSLGLLGVVFGLTFHGVDGFATPMIVGALVVGTASLAAFVRVERRVAEPLVPTSLLARPLFLAAVTSEFSLAFFYTTALFLMPVYLSAQRGLDALHLGLMMLPATATVALMSPVVGRLVERVGPLPAIGVGFVLFVVSGVGQATLGERSSLWWVAAPLVLMGLGWALTLGPAAVAALSSVPASRSGLAVGASWTCHNLGGAVGLALSMTVFRAVADSAGFTRGHAAAMLFVAGEATLTVVVLLVISRRAHVGSDR